MTVVVIRTSKKTRPSVTIVDALISSFWMIMQPPTKTAAITKEAMKALAGFVL